MTEDFIPTAYQQFIYKSRYSKWIEEKGRREEWPETVDRFMDFIEDSMLEKHGFRDPKLMAQIRDKIIHLKVFPSMRALMTAGPAAQRSNIALYNCAYAAVDSLRVFDEALYILMNGTGFGFSVEHNAVQQLPAVPESFTKSDFKYRVEDSKEGWAYALRYVLESLFQGVIPDWDLSDLREAGARLKTFGGRSSGPEPLNALLNNTVELVYAARGRQLTPSECHDLMCFIAEIVVVGGVRRAALISLSNLDDEDMRFAKAGSWWEDNPQRALANNSAVYARTPEEDVFWEEWNALIASGSGERGVVNRKAINDKLRRANREVRDLVGLNPCGEILLRSMQFCNLSSVVIEATDTRETLLEKVRIAAYIGTIQSSFTDFPLLRNSWTENCEEERLLGVSLNGVFNNKLTWDNEGLPQLLEDLKTAAIEANAELADKLGINRSKSVTTIKPEGTSSQFANVSSGIHPWFAKSYIRRVRGDKKDPLGQFMDFYGVENEPERFNPDATEVFSFPISAPEGAATRDDLSAIDHLKVWLQYSRHWAQHNPSVTISVKEEEWQEVGEWVYRHFDELVGVSFLPWDGGTYEQAPYEAVSEERLSALAKKTPRKLPWENLSLFESEDTTSSSQELACVAGGCEIETVS